MSEVFTEDRGLPPLFDIGAVLRTLWDRRVLVLGAAGAALLLALLYISVTKPTYTATSSLLVDPRDSRATNLNSVLPGIGADSAAIASQVSVIDSTDLLRKVFDEEKLRNDPEFAGRGLLSSILSVLRPGSGPTDDAVFERFRKHVSVEREGLTYVIDVSVQSHDAEKAARIAQDIVARYRASLEGQTDAANSKVNDLLTARISGLQAAVGDAERAVQDFKYEHNIFDASSGGTLQSQIDQLTTQLVTTQDQADQAESKYDQAVAAGTGPDGLNKLAEIVNSNTTDKLRQDYNQRAAALANAQSTYGPRHPTIVRMQAELGRIRGLMALEAQRITRELKASRDIAVENVKKIQAKLAEMRQRSNQSDLAEVQLRQLQRKADAARAVLDDFLKRSQETEHLQGMQISQVRVISDAIPPSQPSWPKPLLLLPTSLVLGFVLGCALALALGERRLPVRGLPARPAIGPRERRVEALAYTPSPDGEAADAAEDGEPVAPALVNLGTYNLPPAGNGSLRNSVRAIRQEMSRLENTAFLLSVQELLVRITDRLDEGGRPFVILLTSIHEGFESGATATLIGIGLQHVKQKVLVVEIADRPAGTGQSAGKAKQRATGPFTDPASGLQTIVVSIDPADAGGEAGALAPILAGPAQEFDFVLVVGHPLSHPAFSPEPIDGSDLVIFALSSADWMSGAAAWLGGRLSPAVLKRSATIVIERDPNDPAEFQDSPTLAARKNRRAPAPAHG
jgi:uncharacterized protein involved in exopolysaccharide biosynthesis